MLYGSHLRGRLFNNETFPIQNNCRKNVSCTNFNKMKNYYIGLSTNWWTSKSVVDKTSHLYVTQFVNIFDIKELSFSKRFYEACYKIGVKKSLQDNARKLLVLIGIGTVK